MFKIDKYAARSLHKQEMIKNQYKQLLLCTKIRRKLLQDRNWSLSYLYLTISTVLISLIVLNF